MQRRQDSEQTMRGENASDQGEERRQPIQQETTGADARTPCFLASVLVPRAGSARDIPALETAMQGLVPDARHPVALELAASASSRHFLLRAISAMALAHLADQVQARYPQAIIRPVAGAGDPLFCRDGEEVSAVELRAGAATYLPLHAWRERQLLQEGADPLLGILGVFNHLPPHLRVVAHLALIPASPTWSSPYRRKSVEHPLEQEHLRARRQMSGSQESGPSTFQLVGLGVLVAFLLVWWRFQQQLDALIPSWLLQAVFSVLHGTAPRLSSAQLTTLILGGIVLLVALFLLAFAVLQIRNRVGTTAPYNMRLVEEKTARPAYRVRLRLFAFFSDPCAPLIPRIHSMQTLVQYLTRQSLTWQTLREVSHDWRDERERDAQQRQERGDLLNHLVAAYRQYHTASGGYFVSRRLSRRKARRLLTKQKGWLRSRVSGWHHDLARSPHLLSVADIAALWHLPQAQDLADLPFVERTRARTALAPAELSLGGWKLGTSSHAGHSVPVFLPAECLRHNLLAVASIGKGKSTLFQHLAQALCLLRQEMGEAARPGLAFIEPHGDVVHALCGLLPASERDNMAVVDLADSDYPVGLNPLDMTGRDRDKAVDTLITLRAPVGSQLRLAHRKRAGICP